MRRLSLLIVTLVIVALGIYAAFFLEYEARAPAGWPSSVKLYRKSALGGLTRVVDTSSGEFLFMYLPEYDGNVHPIKIEKIDDRHWQVLFEAPQK